jgi:hypothetical protein
MPSNLTFLHQENLLQRKKWQNICVILLLLILVQSVAIIILSVEAAKNKEVIKYVEFSTKGDFGFTVLSDAKVDLSQRKLLIEQQLQNYVINRVSNIATKKTNNRELDHEKVKFVLAYSNIEVSKQYSNELLKIYNDSEFKNRDVQILSYSEIEDRKYRFDFKTIDTYEDSRIEENRWVVYVKYDLIDPNQIKLAEYKEINPLGVKITYYRGDIDRKQKIEINNVLDKNNN